jgi:hypothetical protein
MSYLVKAKTLAPGVSLYENALSKEICDRIITQGQNDFSWQEATVFYKDGSQDIKKQYRDNKVMNLAPSYANDTFWFSLSQLIWTYGVEYCNEYSISFSTFETPQMLKYDAGTGYYVNHIDSVPNNPRIFSMLIYLNDVDFGGETYFDKIDLTVKPNIGNLVIFPSDYVYSHEALAPISGEKFVIATWFTP